MSRRPKHGRSSVKGGRGSDLLAPARAARAAFSSSAAADVEELGYLLGCLRQHSRHAVVGAQQPQQPHSQLSVVLESAVKQAFPASSNSGTSWAMLLTLRGQWLNATARLLDKSNKGARSAVDWARNPTDLARVLHRVFHCSPSDGRGAEPPRDFGGGGTGRRAKNAPAVAAAASSSSVGPPTSLELFRNAPVGTLEFTVTDGRGSGVKSAATKTATAAESLDVREVSPISEVSGTDTATSSSSSDEDDAFGRGVYNAADSLLREGSLEVIQHLLFRRFVEALHLEVVGRSPSVLGGRLFHVYPLTGPVRPIVSLKQLRKQMEHEFYVLQCGVPRRRPAGQQVRAAKDCRVYVCRPPKSPTLLWMQVHIGSSGTATPKKKGSTSPWSPRRSSAASTTFAYHIVLQAGGRHVAVSSSWGAGLVQARSSPPTKCAAKERTKILQWVLAALDACATAADLSSALSATRTTKKAKIHVYSSVDSMSGPDPLDLLRSSSSMVDRTAMGRFRMYDSQLKKAGEVTPSTLDGISTDEATMQPPQHQVPGIVTRFGAHGMVLQHSTRAQVDRKRSHVEHFGRAEDCPTRRRIRWDLERVDSTAATEAVLASSLPRQCLHVTELTSLPTTPIQCRVALQGPDVIEGLRAMMETGDLGTCGGRDGTAVHLPSCVRDVPSSSVETIKVVNGAVALC